MTLYSTCARALTFEKFEKCVRLAPAALGDGQNVLSHQLVLCPRCFEHLVSSIDMYNNDVGQESALNL